MCCRYEQPRGLQGSEAARRESWAAPFSFHLSPSLTPDGGADTDAALSALQSGGATPGNEGATPEAGVLRPPDGFTSGMWADRPAAEQDRVWPPLRTRGDASCSPQGPPAAGTVRPARAVPTAPASPPTALCTRPGCDCGGASLQNCLRTGVCLLLTENPARASR